MYDRSKSIGASDAVHIQSGKWAELYDRKQSTDVPQYGLPAELGKYLEPFNVGCFERETGRSVFIDPEWPTKPLRLAEYPWCTYLPDGLLEPEESDDLTICTGEAFILIPFEAKCINMMWNPALLLRKYMPQLQHAMRVMSAPYCYFSVLYLNTKFEVTKIDYDEPFDDALFEKEKLFYWHLEQGIRPPEYKGKRAGWIE